MSESLAAACGQFEQVILADMLRSAGLGKPVEVDLDAADGSEQSAGDDAVRQLFVQALSGALERAGGFGLRRSLSAALADKSS